MNRTRHGKARIFVGTATAMAHRGNVDVLIRGMRPWRLRAQLGLSLVKLGVKVTGMKLRTFRVRYDD